MGRGANGANLSASAAFDALFRINFVLSIAFGNRLNGAFSLASAAADAFIGNFVCHGEFTSFSLSACRWKESIATLTYHNTAGHGLQDGVEILLPGVAGMSNMGNTWRMVPSSWGVKGKVEICAANTT